jgi:hypothetical protein
MSDEMPYDFTDAALIGMMLSASILALLVDRGVVSHDDAIDLIDDALMQLEEFQNSFPEYRAAFQSARGFLTRSLDGYRANRPTRPDTPLGS